MATTRTPAAPRKKRKTDTHERIIASAGRIVRRKGLAAASVSRVMHGAGLTVGGFYAHFRSRRAMDAEVVRTMLTRSPSSWFEGLDRYAGEEWLSHAVARYLRTAHRDNPNGCAFPTVLSDLAHADDRTRAAMADAFEARAAAFAAHAPRVPGTTARERALATLVLCIGGLALSRAMRGGKTSRDVLAACRKWAIAGAPPPRTRRAPSPRAS